MSKNKKQYGNALESFKKSITDEIHQALYDVLPIFAKSFRIELRGFSSAEFELHDDNAGNEWPVSSKLGPMVSEYIRMMTPASYDDLETQEAHAEWTNCVAADFERQAKRLRRHAEKLVKTEGAEPESEPVF